MKYEATAPNATYHGIQVVNVPVVPEGSGAPTSPADGTQLVAPVTLAAGQYLIQGTAQFFDFNPTAGTKTDYGVVGIFLGANKLANSWTPAIPHDNNNAAQTSGSFVVTVPAGGSTLSEVADVRGGDSGSMQAGGNLIITKLG